MNEQYDTMLRELDKKQQEILLALARIILMRATITKEKDTFRNASLT